MGVPHPKLHGLTLPFLLFRMLTHSIHVQQFTPFLFHFMLLIPKVPIIFPLTCTIFFFFCFAILWPPWTLHAPLLFENGYFHHPSVVWEKKMQYKGQNCVNFIFLRYFFDFSTLQWWSTCSSCSGLKKKDWATVI